MVDTAKTDQKMKEGSSMFGPGLKITAPEGIHPCRSKSKRAGQYWGTHRYPMERSDTKQRSTASKTVRPNSRALVCTNTTAPRRPRHRECKETEAKRGMWLEAAGLVLDCAHGVEVVALFLQKEDLTMALTLLPSSHATVLWMRWHFVINIGTHNWHGLVPRLFPSCSGWRWKATL